MQKHKAMSISRNSISGIIFILICAGITIFTSIPEEGSRRLSRRERRIIAKSDTVMRVLEVGNPADSAILREKSLNFTDSDLRSKDFIKLSRRMVRTVQDPRYDGVGIAAPQVGVNHRLVVVCRIDREGEPFEVYPNIRIDSLYGEIRTGPEGCLSVPGRRGEVPRYSEIDITYTDMASMTEKSEHVSGYAAVIFQHECDHLEGILYTDRAADTVSFPGR